MINCNGKKHRNKSYANGSNGNFAVLNMTIFLTQANMSPERALEGWLLLQEAYPDR